MAAKNKDYDKKLFRLVSILNKLGTRRGVATKELSEDFGVTMRTAQRDLELLNQAGFPIVTLEDGRHGFMEGFSLKKFDITNEEASLLTFLAEITNSLGDPFKESFRSIFAKALSKQCESPFYAKIPQSDTLRKDYPFLKDLEEAIEECQMITMQYKPKDKEKWFKVGPLKIIFYEGFWYLLAWLDYKEYILKFRLENITKLEVTSDHFEPPKNLKTMLDESTNIWFSEKEKEKVLLRITKEAAKYFKQKKYFPHQKIIKENRDGSLVVESRVGDQREAISTIMHWIPNIHVLEPDKLKQAIKNNIDEYRREL